MSSNWNSRIYDFKIGSPNRDTVFVQLTVENGFLVVSCTLPGDPNTYRLLHVSETGSVAIYENNPIVHDAAIVDSPATDPRRDK